MFDTIYMKCPDCSNSMSIQTKGGECSLKRYPLNKVPFGAAGYVLGDLVTCKNCNKSWKVDTHTTTVSLFLSEPQPDETEEEF